MNPHSSRQSKRKGAFAIVIGMAIALVFGTIAYGHKVLEWYIVIAMIALGFFVAHLMFPDA